MSIAIQTQVWDQSQVSGGDLLVLLRLADAAGDDSRMAWESAKTLAAKTHMSERNVFRCLANLQDHGYIEEVPDEEIPPHARKYRSTVRRIRPVELWGNPDKLSDEETTPDNLSYDAHVIQPQLLTTSNRSHKRTSFSSSSTRRGRVKDLEVDDDPQSHVLAELEGHEEPRPKRDVLDPLVPRKKRSRSSPAKDLVLLFKILAKSGEGTVPGETNDEALRGSIQRWLNDGHSYDLIRDMIETYWSPAFQRSTDVLAWRDFLARRDQLVKIGKKEAAREEVEAARLDPDAWV